MFIIDLPRVSSLHDVQKRSILSGRPPRHEHPIAPSCVATAAGRVRPASVGHRGRHGSLPSLSGQQLVYLTKTEGRISFEGIISSEIIPNLCDKNDSKITIDCGMLRSALFWQPLKGSSSSSGSRGTSSTVQEHIMPPMPSLVLQSYAQ